MENFKNLTLAALTILTIALTNDASAQGSHNLDELHESEENSRKIAFVQRRLALNDPALLRKMSQELSMESSVDESESDSRFPGKSNVVGGDPLVNVTLGISHDQGQHIQDLAETTAITVRPGLVARLLIKLHIRKAA